MKTAIDKVKELNDKTRAWIAEDPDNRGAGLLTEDAAHWSEMNIHTYEDMEHYLLVSDVYEGTKDVYGYKEDWSRLDAMSNEELEEMCNAISKSAEIRYGEYEDIARSEAEEDARIAKKEAEIAEKSANMTSLAEAFDVVFN
jgi:uncharacterized protein with GYD domain